MKASSQLYTVVLPSLGLFCLSGCTANSQHKHEAHYSTPGQSAGHQAIDSRPTDGRGLQSVYEAGYQTQSYILNVELDTSGSTLTVEGHERDPARAEFDQWDIVLNPTGSVVERMTMRHANEWYVARRSTSGTVAIERWTMARTNGAYFTGRRTAPTGIGTPVETPALVTGIQGGQYIEPPNRTAPTFSKDVIVSGLALGQIDTIVIDPDGRYVAIEHSANGNREFVQIPIITSGTSGPAIGDLIPLWDFASNSEFPAIMSFGQYEHATYGRALVIRDLNTSVCFWDADNDGNFETTEVFDSLGAWVSKYPNSCWSRKF
ncbi:MAG: hypothetical protein JNL28_02890 [Planctomycetes bacterium]|nr:hypothetical protein [Planctomycetota bacterium]